MYKSHTAPCDWAVRVNITIHCHQCTYLHPFVASFRCPGGNTAAVMSEHAALSHWLDCWERAACYWWCMSSLENELQTSSSIFSSSLCCSVPCSPDRHIGRKGSVLPRFGLGPGSVFLLPSHPQEHHQTNLLLQSSWESLGSGLPEMSLLWIRLANS